MLLVRRDMGLSRYRMGERLNGDWLVCQLMSIRIVLVGEQLDKNNGFFEVFHRLPEIFVDCHSKPQGFAVSLWMLHCCR